MIVVAEAGRAPGLPLLRYCSPIRDDSAPLGRDAPAHYGQRLDCIVNACIPDAAEFSHDSHGMPFDIAGMEHTLMTFRAC